MEQRQIYHFAGWSAYVSGLAALLLLITVPVFMAFGMPYNLISQYAEVIWFAAIIPVTVAFHELLRSSYRLLSLALLVVGIVGFSYSTIVTSLIKFGPVGFSDNGGFLTATIGVWFLVTSFLLMKNNLQPRGLSVLGIVIGASYMMGLLGLLFIETLLMVFGTHVLVVSLLFPVWAFWTGHSLLKLHQRIYTNST